MLHRDHAAEPLSYLRHLASLKDEHWERAPLHFRPQASFLGKGGAKGLSFVGRFEQLDDEYARLLGASGRVRAHATPQLGHHRKAIPAAAGLDLDTARREHEARMKWAQHEELRALVREVYAADYALLEDIAVSASAAATATATAAAAAAAPLLPPRPLVRQNSGDAPKSHASKERPERMSARKLHASSLPTGA